MPAPAAMLTAQLDTELVVEDERWRRIARIEWLTQAVASALVSEAPTEFSEPVKVTIMLADDSRVSTLNANFRGKPVPTNVLSFPAGANATEPGNKRYLGDIIIAWETVEREANELGIPVENHLQHLIVHGLLHLLGYDHMIDAEAEIMEAIETQALNRVGVPDPYAPTADETARR